MCMWPDCRVPISQLHGLPGEAWLRELPADLMALRSSGKRCGALWGWIMAINHPLVITNFCRIRKGSRFTRGVGVELSSPDVAQPSATVRNRPLRNRSQPSATVRNRPQPSATVRNRPRESQMAVPMEVPERLLEGGNCFGGKRPLAATCGHSLGTVWSGHLRPLAATCGHLRPLAWNCLERPLAATCDHLRPLAWKCLERPLAATCGHSLATVWSGHLRPLAVTSGCKLLPCTCLRGLLRPLVPLAPAAICSQTTSGYKWLQAASGCEWLHAACWRTYMEELASWKKSVLLERRFFFKFAGWIGSIS